MGAHPDLDQAIYDRLSGSGEFLPRDDDNLRKDADMATENSNETENNTLKEAAEEAVEALEPFERQVPDDLMGGLRFIATGKTRKSDDESGAERLATSLGELGELEGVAKSDSLRQAVRKARKAVEAEYLAQMSPQAARARDRDLANL